jgi:hypothetical protein
MPKPHVERINELSIEDIAGLQLWEVLDLAIPRGKRQRVAEIINEKYRTLSSWCNDPAATSDRYEANGRRGMPHSFVSFLLAIHAQCPEGAALYLRWLECQVAEADAVQGRDKLTAALQVADEVRALAEQIIAKTGGPDREKT